MKRLLIYIIIMALFFLAASCAKEPQVYADFEGYQAAQNPTYTVEMESPVPFSWSYQASSGQNGHGTSGEFSFQGKEDWIRIRIQTEEPAGVDVKVYRNEDIIWQRIVSCYPASGYDFEFDLK